MSPASLIWQLHVKATDHFRMRIVRPTTDASTWLLCAPVGTRVSGSRVTDAHSLEAVTPAFKLRS